MPISADTIQRSTTCCCRSHGVVSVISGYCYYLEPEIRRKDYCGNIIETIPAVMRWYVNHNADLYNIILYVWRYNQPIDVLYVEDGVVTEGDNNYGITFNPVENKFEIDGLPDDAVIFGLEFPNGKSGVEVGYAIDLDNYEIADYQYGVKENGQFDADGHAILIPLNSTDTVTNVLTGRGGYVAQGYQHHWRNASGGVPAFTDADFGKEIRYTLHYFNEYDKPDTTTGSYWIFANLSPFAAWQPSRYFSATDNLDEPPEYLKSVWQRQIKTGYLLRSIDETLTQPVTPPPYTQVFFTLDEYGNQVYQIRQTEYPSFFGDEFDIVLDDNISGNTFIYYSLSLRGIPFIQYNNYNVRRYDYSEGYPNDENYIFSGLTWDYSSDNADQIPTNLKTFVFSNPCPYLHPHPPSETYTNFLVGDFTLQTQQTIIVPYVQQGNFWKPGLQGNILGDSYPGVAEIINAYTWSFAGQSFSKGISIESLTDWITRGIGLYNRIDTAPNVGLPYTCPIIDTVQKDCTTSSNSSTGTSSNTSNNTSVTTSTGTSSNTSNNTSVSTSTGTSSNTSNNTSVSTSTRTSEDTSVYTTQQTSNNTSDNTSSDTSNDTSVQTTITTTWGTSTNLPTTISTTASTSTSYNQKY